MAWIVPLNDILPQQITKLDCTITPPGFHGDARSLRMVQESLTKAIDALGAESSAAQGLSRVITTGEKLQKEPSNVLYVLKDAMGQGGKGELIGLLKVGRKHLYLYDEHDKVVEVEPVCVLDFFVRNDRQRHGHGRTLFDYMLKDTGATPLQLAVDGPSPKMELFLKKGYGVSHLVRQSNNFAVAPQFFGASGVDRSSRTSHPQTSPTAYGRFAASRRQSNVGAVIHGSNSAYQITNKPVLETMQQDVADVTAAPADDDADGEVVDAANSDRDSCEVESEVRPNRERPTTLHVETAAAVPSARAAGLSQMSSAGSSDAQLTSRGHVDLKYYHSRLW